MRKEKKKIASRIDSKNEKFSTKKIIFKDLKMKVLALDYDGVIVDSEMDALFVSHNAYLELTGNRNQRLFGGEKFTFQNWLEIQKKYEREIKYYQSLRPYIREATDYGLIQKLIEENIFLSNQREFDQYRQTVQFEFKKFHKLFYEERMKLQEEDFQKWLALETAYTEVVEGIRRFSQEGVKVVVATSNRRDSIARVFRPEYYNIPIRDEDILDISFGEDKSNQIKYMTTCYGVEYEEIYFVDDQLAHLEQTRPLGIKVFLAGWSYATSRQKKRAVSQGIPVIEKAVDFYDTVRQYVKNNHT